MYIMARINRYDVLSATAIKPGVSGFFTRSKTSVPVSDSQDIVVLSTVGGLNHLAKNVCVDCGAARRKHGVPVVTGVVFVDKGGATRPGLRCRAKVNQPKSCLTLVSSN